MENLKHVISKNIVDLRKSMNWTQAELAQKLNYSDKTVSKWERAEAIPDIIVLKAIADLFEVSVDYLLVADHEEKRPSSQQVSRHQLHNRLIIAFQSVIGIVLIATIGFVILKLFRIELDFSAWMTYVYALPAVLVVLLVLNSVWGKYKINFVIISFLLWSILLIIYLSFISKNVWLVFIIGIPAQAIILLWTGFRLKEK